jgi:hypothetical protein
LKHRELSLPLSIDYRPVGLTLSPSFVIVLLTICLLGFAPAQSAAQSYTWQNAQIVGGGFVDGIIAHPGQSGLFYARTDVGGAYRYNSSTSKWVPLLDWTTPANWYEIGVETIAIDPENTKMLFMAVGEYAAETYDSDGAILISSNQGASFTSVSMPFRIGSNDNGRNGGERMQVDPNLGSVLFYGTYVDGLWKSTNTGTSWSKVTSFPVTGPTSGAGVIFTTFYKASGSKGTATPTIFVGISQTGSSLYESTNGGSTWTAVSGQPTTLYPTHGEIGPDGNLYLTYGNAIGPNSMTTGQVWKYSISLKTWTNITPPNPNDYSYGFGGVALDPEVSGSLVVTSMDRWYPGDTMWRSTDSGAAWTDVGAAATHNSSISPWINFGASTPSFGDWPAAVVIDPFNSAHAFYGTGATAWTTTNLTNSGGPTWTIGASGIEETVPIQLVSPTSGAPLISALGDICGFTHTSLTASPSIGYTMIPTLETCSGVDWAKSAPSDIVRVGNGTSPFGGYSTNQGTSWTAFGSAAGSSSGGGTVAISADGATIVWAPSDVTPSYTTNHGTSWTSLSSYLPEGVTVLSDGANASLFYAYNPATGTFYASSNKGVSWYTAYSGLPTFGKPYAVTGTQGDVWLATSSGVYHSTSSGSSWSELSSVSSATAISTGKTASGATYPTLYLIGTVAGVNAVFRSVNEGSSWVQINNTANQWGGPGIIAGDPRTFGTVYIGTSGRGIVYGTSPD